MDEGTRATFDLSSWHLGWFAIVNASPNAKVRNPFPVATDLIKPGVVDLKPLLTRVVGLDAYPVFTKQSIAGGGLYVKGVIKLNG